MPRCEINQKEDAIGEVKPARTDEESHIPMNNMIIRLLVQHLQTGIVKSSFLDTHGFKHHQHQPTFFSVSLKQTGELSKILVNGGKKTVHTE